MRQQPFMMHALLNFFSPCESRPSTDRCSSKASPRNRVTPVLLPLTKSPADLTHLYIIRVMIIFRQI